MKFFTLLLISLLVLSNSYAQNNFSAPLNNTPAFKFPLPQHSSLSNTGNQDRRERPAPAPDYQLGNGVYDSVVDWRLKNPSKQFNNNYKDIDLTYDANSNLTNYIQQVWDTTKWKNYTHNSYTYNSNNLITSKIAQNWNDTTGWVNNTDETYTYNSDNKNTGYVFKIWGKTGWINEQKDTFIYTAYDSIANEILEQWNDTTATWQGFYQQLRSYNSNNLMDTLLVQGSNYGGPWMNSLLFTYTYKTDTSVELDQKWASGAWVNSYLYTSSYNAAGLMTSQLGQTANGQSWTNYSLDILTYNNENLNTIFLDQIWDNNMWVNIEQILYSYNASNMDTSQITQINFSSWKNIVKAIKRYNANNVEIESLNYSYNGQSAGDTLTSVDSAYYYLAGPAGVKSVAGNNYNLSVYPNPASDVIHTDIQLNQPSNLQLRLVDLVGQTKWTNNAGIVRNYRNNIPTANLANGVYVLEITTDMGTELREVVVAK